MDDTGLVLRVSRSSVFHPLADSPVNPLGRLTFASFGERVREWRIGEYRSNVGVCFDRGDGNTTKAFYGQALIKHGSRMLRVVDTRTSLALRAPVTKSPIRRC